MHALLLMLVATTTLASAPVPFAPAPDDPPARQRVERHTFPTYVEEITHYVRPTGYATVRLLTHNGQLLLEEHYSDYENRVRRGFSKAWHPNGQLYWVGDYRNGQLNGPFWVYYEDGSVKRRERYRYGLRRSGECFEPDGTPTTCTDFFRPAHYVGGELALRRELGRQYQQARRRWGVQVLTVQFTVNTSGHLSDVVVGSELETSADVVNYTATLLRNLRWEPARIDDVAYVTHHKATLQLAADGNVTWQMR